MSAVDVPVRRLDHAADLSLPAYATADSAGVDLLAYRAVDADPVPLTEAARRGAGDAALIVAGSIDSPARIHAMQQAGVDGVTVGSAVFEMMFAPGENSVGAQLKHILDALD